MSTLNPQITAMISEVQGMDSLLANYYNALGAYLFSPDSNVLPHFKVISDAINVDELLTRAQANVDSNVDLSAGAISSTIFRAKGISREAGTRFMTKSMVYGVGISQVALFGEDITGNSGKVISDMTGNSPSQSEGA